MTQTIGLTGGTGFIGGALIESFLKQNIAVKALVRDRSRCGSWENDVEIIEGDLFDASALNALATDTGAIVHGAGVTHAIALQIYEKANVVGARNVANAAFDAGAKLVHLSSISARMPALSAYAASKRQSEDAVAGANAIALRLPAIYGPRDMVTLPYFKMVKTGIAPEPATPSAARASILHVEDAAHAIGHAISTSLKPGVYEIGDDRPEGYFWHEIGSILGSVMGKTPKRLRAPRQILAPYHSASFAISRLRKKTPSVRQGQINEFFHPDWVARDNLFNKIADWAPENSLKEGFAKTVRWYQEQGYL